MLALSDSALSSWNWWLGIIAVFSLGIGFLSAIGTLLIGRELEARKDFAQARLSAELKVASSSATEARDLAVTLQAKQLPRLITPEQRTVFINTLEGAPRGKVQILFASGDTETYDFARQMSDLVRFAGYDAPEQVQTFGAWRSFGPPPRGVRVCVRNLATQPPHAGMLMIALQNMGLKAMPQVIDTHGDDIVVVALGYKE